MRRRYARRRLMIPDYIMTAEGEYERAPEVAWGEERPKVPWVVWCEATGYSKVEFLRESIRRQLERWALEDPAGPWRAFHPDPRHHGPRTAVAHPE